MKLTELIKEKFFNTKDFYNRIINGNYPIKYMRTGKYLKNIFNLYGYSSELVTDSINFFNYLSKNKFDFRNMDNFTLITFDSFMKHDYKTLFEYYDIIFIKKNYEPLYNIFDDFVKRINTDNIKLGDNYADLDCLILIHSKNKVAIREHYLDNMIEKYVNNILRIITILFWINNKKEFAELTTITYQVLLKDDFIDRCVIKGMDITSLSFYQLNYIANQIYNNEFIESKKKLIK